MLLGITDGGKLGLGLFAGLLIVFAVLSSFYFPRRNPDFPGNRLGLFIAVAVAPLRGDDGRASSSSRPRKRRRHGAEATSHRDGDGREPGDDDRGGRWRRKATPRPARPSSPRRAAAAATRSRRRAPPATVGPNLDQAKPDAALVVDRVTNGKGAMPSFEGQLSEKQIQDVAAYVVASTQG